MIGAHELAMDLEFARHGALELEIGTDSFSAIGIAGRRGCGRIRHLETGSLRIQAALHHGRFAIVKVPGEINPADMMTKGLNGEDTSKFLRTLNMDRRSGRSNALPDSSLVQRLAGRTHVTMP